MPTSPHRRVQRDATAKRRRSRVQRASEAPDGETTTSPRTMLVALARKARLLANRSSFKYKWNSGMPPGPATA